MAYIDPYKPQFSVDIDSQISDIDRKYDRLEGLVFTGHPTPPDKRVQRRLRLVERRNKKMWEGINDISKNSK